MKVLAAMLTGLALALAACNANPLLKAAASDYAPLRLGSRWDYKSPDGATTLARIVSSAGPYQGLDAFTVDSSLNSGPVVPAYWAFKDGELLQHSASLGWILSRRLPLVNGNRWTVPSGSALATTTVQVDNLEKATVPAGEFDGCFKLRTRVATYNPLSGLTSTAESLVWVAPGVGDVRYASLAADGSITTTLELVGYSIP